MKYFVWCLCACSILGHSVEKVPVILPEDLRVLGELAQHATQYMSGKELLNQTQTVILKRLIEESDQSKVAFSAMIPQAETLLQIMEMVAEKKGPLSTAEVITARRVELETSGWALQEVATLLSEQSAQTFKKYIAFAETHGNLNGFTTFERSRLLRWASQHLGSGFTLEELSTLRRVELKARGFLDLEIESLKGMTKRKDPEYPLTAEEVAVLKKWIQVKCLESNVDLVSFEEQAAFHEIIQNGSSPPFSPQEIKSDLLAFQRQLESAPEVPLDILQTLKQTAGNVSAYLGESQTLSSEQEKACQYFVEVMGQFGRIPGLDQEQIGRLVQLIEMRPEFQQLMYSLKTVFYIELVESGFTASQKKELDLLRERVSYNPQASLSKREVSVLKEYIAKAKMPGGLNGFTMQERSSLFFIVQNRLSQFISADVELLRRKEQAMNGFSPEEIHELKLIAKRKKSSASLSLEQQLLVKRFHQVERVVGEGFLINAQAAPH